VLAKHFSFVLTVAGARLEGIESKTRNADCALPHPQLARRSGSPSATPKALTAFARSA
jgi:hypothetical protein